MSVGLRSLPNQVERSSILRQSALSPPSMLHGQAAPESADVTRLQAHGGARRGTGRKPKGRVASVMHLARPRLSGREPVLVTLKFESTLPSARSQFAFRLILRSLACARDRFGMRVIQFSVQRDHIHLLVEAASSAALTRAMKGLAVRLARGLNRRLKRRGRVFKERYHGRVLATPRQVRNALAYVLSNGRKHGHAPDGARG